MSIHTSAVQLPILDLSRFNAACCTITASSIWSAMAYRRN